MVAQFTMRKYGVNQAIRFVEGICLRQKCRQIRRKKIRKDLFHITCTPCSELPSYISTMAWVDPLYRGTFIRW